MGDGGDAGRGRDSPRPQITLRLSLTLRHEREKAARVVLHDLAKDLVTRPNGLQLWKERGERLAVAAGRVRREHQAIGKSGFEQRHDQRYLLRIVVATL